MRKVDRPAARLARVHDDRRDLSPPIVWVDLGAFAGDRSVQLIAAWSKPVLETEANHACATGREPPCWSVAQLRAGREGRVSALVLEGDRKIGSIVWAWNRTSSPTRHGSPWTMSNCGPPSSSSSGRPPAPPREPRVASRDRQSRPPPVVGAGIDLVVRLRDRRRMPDRLHLPAVEHHRAVAEPLDPLMSWVTNTIVRPFRWRRRTRRGTSAESGITDRQHLVDQHDLGVHLDRHRKGEPDLHAGGVVLELQVDEPSRPAKAISLVPFAHRRGREAEHDRG